MPPPREVTRRTATVGALAAIAGAAVLASRAADAAPTAPVAAAALNRPRLPDAEPSAAPASPPSAVRRQSGPRPARDLPRGGRTLFPAHRVVAFCGLPGAPALGRLGVGRLDDRVRELEALAGRHRGTGDLEREPLPALELVTVVAQARPGDDGRYRTRVDAAVVEAHLAAARRHRALLLLNVQPGRSDFGTEVRALERWLREPDVGLALDPEWRVGPGQRPGQVLGRVTGRELDGVSAWLADLVAGRDLPEKMLVVHQLAPSVVRAPAPLRRRPGVRAVRSVDGIGTPAQKRRTWDRVQRPAPAAGRREAASGDGVLRAGFKIFLGEDTRGGSRLMTPAETLALDPAPDYVCFE